MTRLLSSSSTSSKSSRSSKSSGTSTQTAQTLPSPTSPTSEWAHCRTKSDSSTFSFRRRSSREPSRAAVAAANAAGARHSVVSPSPPPSPAYEAKDSLPGDSTALDGLLNYHLSQLGRIKREVVGYNTTIEQLEYTYCDMVQHTASSFTAKMLWSRIQAERTARNNLCSFAMFHVDEIERIVQHKASVACSPEIVTNIYKQMPTYHEWNELFC
ncbi:hypothetical protein KEM54_004123 [Ascosphaera aggregata]|nr:hypothetical protein KEM54_004123 [Ascosphaera aggregata]